MPDLEISNLPELAEAGVAGTDPLAIADISASETKQVTVTALIKAGITSLSAGDISAAKIGTLGTDQVATGAIQDDAVTNAKIEYPSISLGGLTLVLGSTDATPALNLTDATNYPTSSLTGTISNAQLAGSIANNKLANSSVSFGGVSLALGGTDATPAFDLQDATGYKTTSLVGTITNAQLAGSIANSKLVASSVSLGGVSVALGGTDATPAFNLTDATNYPTSALVGTITNAQLAGSIANAKLVNSSVSLGGVSIALGGTDATPAFNLTDATGYPASSLVGSITNAQLAGSIDVSKLAGTTAISLGGVSIALGGTDATPAFNLTDATNYPAASLTGTISNAQLAGSIANTKLANSSVSFGGITVALGASDATPAFDLTDATNYPASSLTGTITNAQLAGSINVSKLTSSSASIGGVTITLGTTDATPAFDLQDATGYPASALTGTITNAQLAGSIAATKLVAGSITSTQLDSDSVTASELANNAVDTGAVQNGAITNDKVETSTSATTGLDGATKIRDATITPAKLNTANLDRSLNVASGNLGINNAVSGGASTRSGISYNAEGLITGTVALAAADLPKATTSAVGGVSIGAGLSVTGTGALSITNSVTANAAGAVKVTYNAQGQITGSSTLAAGDIPTATTSAKGGVQITSGGGLTVDGSGNLTTSTSGVSGGTYQSVEVNAKGVVIAGAGLTAALIPDLPANKITSGSIDAARIEPDSIDGTKLSNASTAIFQSVQQTGSYPTAQFNGQLLFDTVSEDCFIWDGNAWQAITTLTKGSLVFGGNFNANTSKMTACTSAGLAAGLAVGSNLPTPSATTDGLYVVVDTSGTPSAPAPVVALAPPDYILGVTNSAGSSWNEIDLSQTVAGQVASNITFTPYGQLSSTNVQDALQELETEKMGFAGGTVTGQLLIGNTGSLVFEGSSIDLYQTTIGVTNPTQSDKTILFPDISGTVITTGDTGSITGTMIANGTIQNVDIHADAAIAFTKLADLTSAQILVGNGSNEPTAVAVTGDISIDNAGLTSIASGVIVDDDIKSDADITGTKVSQGTTSARGTLQLTNATDSASTTTAATPAAVKIAKDAADAAAVTANAALPKAGGTMTDTLLVDNDKEVRFFEADSNGSNYVGIKGATDKASSGSYTISLPAAPPATGQVLKAGSTATTLEWAADSATDSTKMPLAGGTFTGDVTFTGDSSNGLWDKSASAFVANLTGNVTGNTSGSSGSCTGNAATATALASSVNIGGVAFDGTASINLPGVNAAGNQSTTGNAATATKFASAVTIGGVSFDGSANINLPGVNAAGTQDTSGTAALATEFTVTANNSTDETVYPLFVDGATGSQGAETDTGLTYNPSTGLLTSTGFSGVGTSLTDLDADNISAGTVDAARLGSGSSVTTKFLRGDNTWQTISSTPEGTDIKSTGESGGNKFLREDGDGTCSWQTATTSAAGSNTQIQYNSSGSFAGSANLTFDGTHLSLADQSKLKLGASGDLEVFTDVGGDGMAHITSDLSLNINSDSTLSFKNNGSTKLSIDNSGVNGSNIHSLPAATCFSGSGQIPVARLGTGTASSSNFLRGDGSWAAAGGGTSYDTTRHNLNVDNAGNGNGYGYNHISIGDEANDSLDNTSNANISLGLRCGKGITSGSNNIAIGKDCVGANNVTTTGNRNIGIGYENMYSLTSGTQNLALGYEALRAVTTGPDNIAIGYQAGHDLVDADHCILIGDQAGSKIQSGADNIFIGEEAGKVVVDYGTNIGIGKRAIWQLTGGSNNCVVGHSAGTEITVGDHNTFLGTSAGYQTTTGDYNITIGSNCYGSSTGDHNIFMGKSAGGFSTGGSYNICLGFESAKNHGNYQNEKNTVVGYQAAYKLFRGDKNVAIGTESLWSVFDGDSNVAIGDKAGYNLKDTHNNTFVGHDAGSTSVSGANLTCLGYGAEPTSTTVTNEVTIGNSSITKFRVPGIDFVLKDNGGTPSSGQVLTADSNGEGYWAAASSGVSSDAQYNTVGGTNAGDSFSGTSAGSNTLFGYDAGTAITSGDDNTCFGTNAAHRLTTGGKNNCFGSGAGQGPFGGSPTYSMCTFIGFEAGNKASSTSDCVCIGNETARELTTGIKNIAIGSYAAHHITTGQSNTIIGTSAGKQNDTGAYNTYLGRDTGKETTTGSYNTAIGADAFENNTTASGQTAVGYQALQTLSGTAYDNTAIGNASQKMTTAANGNTTVGASAGEYITTGGYNCAFGYKAGGGHSTSTTASNFVGIGVFALHKISTGSNSVAVGYNALSELSTGQNCVAIGYEAGRSSSPSGEVTTGSNIICLGNDDITDLYCADTSISSSDSRDKTDVTNFTHGLDWVNKLNPITYRWDKRSWYSDDLSAIPDGSKKTARQHIGFLAQDVLAVEQADGFASKKDDMLVVNLNEDDTGYGLKYERLVPVLVNAIKELSAKVEALEAKLA